MALSMSDMEQLVERASLPLLNGFAVGGVRAKILDVLDRGDIDAVQAFALMGECDKRIDRNGVKFGSEKPAEVAVAEIHRPERRELPCPFALDDDGLLWCARARWCPDDAVPVADTLAEQGSRIVSYVAACQMARTDGRDLGPRDRRAIWAAVAGQVALVRHRREGVANGG